MVNLFRLICFAFFTFTSSAHAVINPIAQWQVETATGGWSTSFSSAQAACEFALSSQDASVPVRGPIVVHPDLCEFYRVSDGAALGARLRKSSSVCPANSIDFGGTLGCMCQAGFEDKDGQCRPVNPCPADQEEQGGACVPKKCAPKEIRVNGFCVPDPDLCPDGSQKVDGECKEKKCEKDKDNDVEGAKSMPNAMCFNGCTVIKQKGFVCTENGCTYTYTNTGGTCDSPPYDPSKPPGGDPDTDKDKDTGGNTGGGGEAGGGNTGGGGGGGGNNNGNNRPNVPGTDPGNDGKCPAGKYKSGDKCFSNDPDKKPAGEGTNTDGEGNCPEGQFKKNNKCWDKKPDANGNEACPDNYTRKGQLCVANQPQSDKDKDKTFCQANPDLAICKGSKFGGSCGANFSCEGDVLQCSIAREQHIRNCKLYDEKSPESLLYDQHKGKEGNATEDLPGNETLDMGSRIDTTDVFGGGSGVQNLNLTVAGRAVTLDFSGLNDPLRALGLLLVGISFLIAFRIVGRG